MKRTLSMLALSAAFIVAGSSISVATGNGQDKLYLCHRTASQTNPYVLIHVPTPAQLQAHLSGDLKGHLPTRVGQDYIPTQYEIENGCGTEPEPSPSPEPTPRPTPEPTPPPTVTVPEPDPAVRVRSCGDPRLLVTLSNYGDGTITYRIVVTTQNKGRKVFTRRVGPDQTKVLAPIWYRGGSKVVIRADGEVVYRGKPKTRGWNKGVCPVSLKAAQREARAR